MSETSRGGHWNRIYTARADTDVSWYEADPATSVEFIQRCGPEAGARVIDVGGGTSRLVDRLLDLGLRPTVLDVSAAALDRARRRLGSRAADVEWRTADITRAELRGPFDLWHDRAVYHFLTDADDRRAYTARLRSAVPPGGWVVMATFAADGPTRCSGLDTCRYGARELERALAPGVRLVEERVVDHVTPSGAVQRFQYVRMRRVDDENVPSEDGGDVA